MPFSGSGTGIQNADDVFFSSVSDGHTLIYDSGTAKWNNATPPSGSAIGVSVTDHGAVGDGSTDDTAAINAAITAAGVGGTVFFPNSTGPYMVSSSLKPLSRQTWLGEHTPLFWGLEYDLDFRGDGGAIRATASFSGTALIHNTSTGYRAKGVRLEKLLLLGNGESGSLHGIDLGPDSSGETTWRIHSIQLHAFGGAALTGHAWVLDVRDTLVGRCGYGWVPSLGAGGSSCTAYDVRMIGCNFYFTYHDGISFNATSKAGAITLIGNRFERAGTTQGNVHVNRDENAVGIKLVRANNIQMIGNYTDANAKHGLEIDAAAVGDVVHILSAGNMWNRDGTGDNATTSLPGLRIYQGKYVNFDGDHISYGKPNDDGAPGYVSPQWGVEFDSTVFCSWNGAVELASNTVSQAFKITETTTENWRLRLNENRTRSAMAAMTSADAPVNPQEGDFYFDDTLNKIRFWNGTAWETTGGGSAHTVQDEGSALTQRSGLDFVGAGVTVTDDSGNDKTVVTIPGGSGGGVSSMVDIKDPTYGAAGDDSTDDTAAIQAALTAGAGGVVWVPEGTFMITSALSVPANTKVDGVGTIRQATNAVHGLDLADGCKIAGITLAGPYSAAYGGGSYGIYSVGTSAASPYTNTAILDVELYGWGHTAILLQYNKDFTVRGCNIHDCGYTGVAVLSGKVGRIVDSKFDNITPGSSGNMYGVALTSGGGAPSVDPRTENVVVSANVFSRIEWEALDTHGGINLTITGNTFQGIGNGNAVALVGGPNNTPPEYITVTGNTFDSMLDVPTETPAGKECPVLCYGLGAATPARGVVVTGNTMRRMTGCNIAYTEGFVFSNNTLSDMHGTGINFAYNNTGATVVGNTCSDVWADGANTAFVRVSGNGVVDGTLSGNTLLRGSMDNNGGSRLISQFGLRNLGTCNFILGVNDFYAATYDPFSNFSDVSLGFFPTFGGAPTQRPSTTNDITSVRNALISLGLIS